MAKEENDSLDEETKQKLFQNIVLVILILILMVITLGLLNSKGRKVTPVPSERDKKKEDKERKEKQLVEVEISIKELEAIKFQIERREWYIKFWTRFGIACILLAGNAWYGYVNIDSFNFDRDIGKFLNLNAFIVTIYSFLAFICYGSIDSFVRRMKEILADVLKRKHLNSLEELELLYKERIDLKASIAYLEKELQVKQD